jgi:hypothetical protein
MRTPAIDVVVGTPVGLERFQSNRSGVNQNRTRKHAGRRAFDYRQPNNAKLTFGRGNLRCIIS